MAENNFPTEIRLERGSRKIQILWEDGHKSDYSFDLLRKICPCALCREERQKRERLQRGELPILTGTVIKPGESAILSIAQVGNYAISFVWQDGHHTGIYTFELLRTYCPCCGADKS